MNAGMRTRTALTEEQRAFVDRIEAIGPGTPEEELCEAIDALRGDMQAQMGRVYIARRAELLPSYICDYYPRTDGAPLERAAFMGVAFYNPAQYVVTPDTHRTMVFREWVGLRPESRAAILGRTTGRSPYAGVPSLDDVLPRMIRCAPGAVITAHADMIPMTEGDATGAALLEQQCCSLRQTLQRRLDAVREAIREWSQASVWQALWHPGRERALLTMQASGQELYRAVDDTQSKARIRMAMRSCAPEERPPTSPEEVRTSLRTLVTAIDHLRLQSDKIGVPQYQP